MRRVISLAAIALAFAGLTGCATTSGIGTSPTGAEIPIEKAAMKFAADVKDGGYQVVSAEGLNKLISEKKDIVIIDTMPAADFAKQRIKGAVNAPMPKSEKELTPAEKEGIIKAAGADKEKTVAVYCGFVACRRSHIGAKILAEEGYKNVLRYPAGIVGWIESNYPVE